MKKLYYYFEGGLGDVMMQYWENGFIAAIPEYKASTPCYVKAVLNVHNPQTAELFRHSPFDEVQCLAFHPEMRDRLLFECENDGFEPGTNIVPLRSGRPPIYLSDDDGKYLEHVMPKDKYIVLHPGAGKRHYQLFGRIEFSMLFDSAEAKGLKVVVVGGTSSKEQQIIIESMPQLKHPACVNMIGIGNPRVVIEAVRKSAGVIGSLSAYIVAAAYQDVRGICFTDFDVECNYVKRMRNMGVTLIRFPQIEQSTAFYEAVVDQCTSKT